MLGSHVSNQTTFYLTGAVLIGICLILFMNALTVFTSSPNEKYLSYNDVRGVAIEHNNLLYTLNFDQQNELIEDINMTLPTGKEGGNQNSQTLPFTKIIVYRFQQPDIVLTPIGMDNQNLIFSATQLKLKGYLRDVTLGKLYNLLSSSYDP